MDENEIYTALGLEAPTGANEQPAAEAAPSNDAGVNDQPVAAADNQTGSTEGSPAADAEPAPDQQTQSREERAQQAAARRQRETQAAIEKARSEERAKYDAAIKATGLTNPLNNNSPITTLDELTAYQEQYNTQQLEKNLKAGKLNRGDLDTLIAQNPTVKAAQQIIDNQQQIEQEQRNAKAKANIDADIKYIHELDPNVNSIDDLLHMENANTFQTYVNKGLTFKEAYQLANYDRLQSRQTAAAQRQTAVNAAGKAHLQATRQGGTGGMSDNVPAEEYAIFKALNPHATDSDIIAYYNKYKQK